MQILKGDLKSGPQNGFYGQSHTKATKQKMSKNHADFSGEKNPMYGVRRFGEDHPMWQRKHTDESNQKNRQSNIDQPYIKCEFCGEDSQKGSYKRWHGDNCKMNKKRKTEKCLIVDWKEPIT